MLIYVALVGMASPTGMSEQIDLPTVISFIRRQSKGGAVLGATHSERQLLRDSQLQYLERSQSLDDYLQQLLTATHPEPWQLH